MPIPFVLCCVDMAWLSLSPLHGNGSLFSSERMKTSRISYASPPAIRKTLSPEVVGAVWMLAAVLTGCAPVPFKSGDAPALTPHTFGPTAVPSPTIGTSSGEETVLTVDSGSLILNDLVKSAPLPNLSVEGLSFNDVGLHDALKLLLQDIVDPGFQTAV